MKLDNFFEKVLNELAFRVPEGIPDLTNKTHLTVLKQLLLEETNYDYSLVFEVMQSIEKNHSLKSISTIMSEADAPPKEEKPKEEPAPKDAPAPAPAPAEKPAPDAGGDAPAEEPAPDAGGDAPAPDAGGDAPAPDAGGDAPAEEPPAEDKPKEEPTDEKPTDDSPKTGNTSSQATINMQNAEKSGQYFSRPSTEYAAAPAAEAIYEHPNGTLFMKLGDNEFQINIDPYSGYKAPIKLNPVEKQKGKDSGKYIGVPADHSTDVGQEGGAAEEK